jgi:hypothetical protein
MHYRNISLIVSACFIVACNDSGRPDVFASIPTPTTTTGVFLDAPVANVDFETATQSGVTNAQGEFVFVDGETVTFSIGDLDFPPVTAGQTVTPLEIAQTNDPNNRQVVNMVRLLQTLDQDGDPSNGITVTDTAKGLASAVDFDVPEADFESNAAVTNLIINAGQDTPPLALISKETALRNFEGTLLDQGDIEFATLVGVWVPADSEMDENDVLGFVFFPDGTYVHVEVDLDDSTETSGMEWGTYEFNRETGLLVPAQTFDENGDTGLTDFNANGPASLSLVISTDRLVANFDEDKDGTDDASMQFDRINLRANSDDPIVGLWTPAESEMDPNDLLLIAFLDDGTYIHMEVEANGVEEEGMEWGTYVRDSETGVMTVTQEFDSNGDTGLTDFTAQGPAILSIEFEGNTLIANFDEDSDGEIDGSTTFVRALSL